ncbi:CobW family GTP-binding protein [Variovorax sp. GB1P17]|uniref:CobW family GTP-binding protein n=1 Tax=Variovorax sp. GB1P17 TaxID=3443740 RepID=UPI003F46D083
MTTSDKNALVPVTLLTGFLGSGKTTVLNALVRRPEMARALVIINEFGQIGLDHLLMAHSAEDIVVEMSSGCLCCTIRGDLVKTLRNALWRFSRGGVRQFNRVVIETTGLADPAPILHTLMTERFVSSRYRLDGVITTIDLATGAQTLDVHTEAVKQVAVADALLLTKEDLVDSQQAQALRDRLKLINPGARQWAVRDGVIAPVAVLNLGLFDAEGKTPDVARWLRTEAYAEAGGEVGHAHDLAHEHKHEQEHGHGHGHGHGHHHDVNRHDDHIRAFCFEVEEPIEAVALEAWLEVMLTLLGPNMLRMKALLNVRGEALPLVLHGVQHILHPAEALPAWPSSRRRSQFVFITRDIDRVVIEESFRRFMQVVPASSAEEPAPW